MRRVGDRDGRDHHGHRLHRPVEQPEGADEVTMTAVRVEESMMIVKERM